MSNITKRVLIALAFVATFILGMLVSSWNSDDSSCETIQTEIERAASED